MMENASEALENSIREEAARIIAGIREKESLEIRQLDDTFAAEIDNFQKQTQAETDARLKQELSRLENRASLERRKLALISVEKFIVRVVDDAVKEIRKNPLYRKFLIDAVCAIVKQIPGKVEIRLKKEDLFLEEEIFAAVGAAGRNNGLTIVEDPCIKWGGCLVVDKSQGRIFNNLIERIYFRKALLIRQKVMEILTESLTQGKEQIVKQSNPEVLM
jgi:flagellar biosynthesis/type III secretory pathway protein FliH